MTQILKSNTDVVKRCYELFAKGDIDTLGNEMLASNITWVVPESLPEGGTYNGRDAVVKKFFPQLPTNYGEGMELHPTNWISSGDWVVVEGHYTGTAPETDTAYDVPFCHVFKIKDGKMVSCTNYEDTALVLEALNG